MTSTSKRYARGCSECVWTGLEKYNPYTKEAIPCKHCTNEPLKNAVEQVNELLGLFMPVPSKKDNKNGS